MAFRPFHSTSCNTAQWVKERLLGSCLDDQLPSPVLQWSSFHNECFAVLNLDKMNSINSFRSNSMNIDDLLCQCIVMNACMLRNFCHYISGLIIYTGIGTGSKQQSLCNQNSVKGNIMQNQMQALSSDIYKPYLNCCIFCL